MAITWNPTPQVANDTVHLDDLQISFKRTIKVPDNNKSSALPPSLGNFPLYEVKNYLDTLPDDLVGKGGLFLPMYRKCYPKYYVQDVVTRTSLMLINTQNVRLCG